MLNLFEADWSDLWEGKTPESLGAVFTKPEIVNLILDLAGYVPGKRRLAAYRVLEPSCGAGAFLSEVVARLIESERNHASSSGWADATLDGALRPADISSASLEQARTGIIEQLREAGCSAARAMELAGAWTVHTDFLLSQWVEKFDLVVGNPPYVRIEDLPKRVLLRYREIFETTTDRADLYVAFFEKGLELLGPTGTLAFICANRFTKNKYGERLRRLITTRYRVRYYVNLEHTQPFLTEVSAYPAIFVIDRQQGASSNTTTLRDVDDLTVQTLSIAAKDDRNGEASPFADFPEWYPHGAPWTTTCRDEYSELAALNANYPTLEESAPNTVVGIGVATGADEVFVLTGC